MPDRTSLSAGLAAIIVGLLAISAVVVGGSDAPEPATVNTSAGANELLVQTYDRLETSDYRRTISDYNISDQTQIFEHRRYYEVSNSNQRREWGFVNPDGSHVEKAYANDVMEWTPGSPHWWPTERYDEWKGRFTFSTPKVGALREVNATVLERTEDEIVVEIPNASLVSRPKSVENRSERWVFTIDAQTGNIIKDELWIDNQGNQWLLRNEYEYGITIERPEGIPFSLTEHYRRFLAMDLYEKIGLIGGPILIIVGCLVLYREYPLHRKLG